MLPQSRVVVVAGVEGAVLGLSEEVGPPDRAYLYF